MSKENKKVVTAFFGSARANGTTAWMLSRVRDGFDKYKDENMIFNKVDLYNYDIKPISRSFIDSPEAKIPHDDMKDLVPMVLTSSVILIASPVYWFSVSGIVKNFMDRWYDFSDAKGKLNLDGKGIAIVTAHANPSNTMAYPVFRMVEEAAKFANMIYLGGADGITSAQKGTNEHELASVSAELLGKRMVEFLKFSKFQ